MENNFETQEKLSDCIPNPAGLPCENQGSDKLRKGHNQWKNAVRQKKMDSQPAVSYWKNMSSCVAL